MSDQLYVNLLNRFNDQQMDLLAVYLIEIMLKTHLLPVIDSFGSTLQMNCTRNRLEYHQDPPFKVICVQFFGSD